MTVWCCFELNGVDTPILRAVKSYSLAAAWLEADRLNRYITPFTVDQEPEIFPPRDMFEYAVQDVTR